MSISINNKIHQRGPHQLLEQVAAAAILPGMIVETLAAGTVQPHSTAGGPGEKTLANEDALQGNTVTTTYNIGDRVRITSEMVGNIVLFLLVAGYNYTEGTKLISNGNGKLKPTTGTPGSYFGVVLVPTNLSASGAVDTLVQCRVW